ncbi:hypothetical protein AC249_AIPGENE8481 [Exaiptasia diaphana]|nr:hypothetical protein AC249_AIPGENE8481 [Exaiptasia diaphana]
MKTKHLFFSLVTLIGPVCGLSASAEPVESNNHQSCKTGRYFFNDHALVSSSYKTTTAPNFGTCYANCMDDKECCSINYKKTTKICQRNNITKTKRPGNFRSQIQTIYAEVRDSPGREALGS